MFGNGKGPCYKGPEISSAVGEPRQITNYVCAKGAKCSWELESTIFLVQNEPKYEVPLGLHLSMCQYFKKKYSSTAESIEEKKIYFNLRSLKKSSTVK